MTLASAWWKCRHQELPPAFLEVILHSELGLLCQVVQLGVPSLLVEGSRHPFIGVVNNLVAAALRLPLLFFGASLALRCWSFGRRSWRRGLWSWIWQR